MQFYAYLAEHSILHTVPLITSGEKQSILAIRLNNRYNFPDDLAGKMTDQEQGLKRELTARQMAMVAVGGSIGTGLLLGSGAAIQVAGPAVVLTFVLSALISYTVAMALGEMSAVLPAAGSFGVYAELYVNR